MRILLVMSMALAGIFGLAVPAGADEDDICAEIDVYGNVGLHPEPQCVPHSGPVACETFDAGNPAVLYVVVRLCHPD